MPELEEAIEQGHLSVPKARKIVPVLTPGNQQVWIQKAKEVPQAQLERDVAEALLSGVKMIEKTKPLGHSKVKLEIALEERTMELLKRAQDLVAQSQGSPNYAETLHEVLTVYLDKVDPLQKAERAQLRKNKRGLAAEGSQKSVTGLAPSALPNTAEASKSVGELKESQDISDLSRDRFEESVESSRRKAIPAAVQQAVRLRDRGRCRARHSSGEICGLQRYLDFHHIVPVALGGKDETENLITLCRSCHQQWHRRGGQEQGKLAETRSRPGF